MKIVVRVELITDWGEARILEAGRIDRPSQTLEPDAVGLTLEDGKRLLAIGNARLTRHLAPSASAVLASSV